MWQQDAQGGVQLRGPIESTTGQMLPAPVPLSPPIVPFTHRYPGCMVPTRSHPANSHHEHGNSQHSGTRRRNVRPLAAGTPLLADSFDPGQRSFIRSTRRQCWFRSPPTTAVYTSLNDCIHEAGLLELL